MNESVDFDQENHNASPEHILIQAAKTFGDSLVVSSSFGIYSAALLHLCSTHIPGIPVIWIDTGYLPAETYRFAEDLSRLLNLNLKVFQSPVSPARMEALYGKLYESDQLSDLDRYDYLRKVLPMNRALEELGASAWISGVRSGQTDNRKSLKTIEQRGSVTRIHPILSWTDEQLRLYIQHNKLPLHPLHKQGYETVGDVHNSRPMRPEDRNPRDSRFNGMKQECGIHLNLSSEQIQAFDSSFL